MIEAQDAGLVRLDGRGGQRVHVLPALLTSYDRGLAAGMFSHDMVHALTTNRVASGLAPMTDAAAAAAST